MSRGGSAGTEPLVAQPHGKGESGQKPAQGDNQGDNAASDGKAGNVALPIKQTPSPHNATIAKTQAQTTQTDPYQLRDLKAQEDMAYWAMWMFVAAVFTFVITSIGTFLIWRQVKLTRQAVEDTDKATRAMERQTNLIEGAQRPWITIEFEPVFAGIRDGIFAVEIVAKLKNVGATSASSVFACVEIFHSDKSYRDGILSRIDEISKSRQETVVAILPNETVERRLTHACTVDELSFFIDEGKEGIFLTFIASVHYRPSGNMPERWLETSRSAMLQRRVRMKGRTDAGFVLSGFLNEPFSCSKDELVMEPLGLERTA